MKDYREKELKYLMIILILLFVVLCTPIKELNITDIELHKSLTTVFSSIVVSSILSLATFICDCLLSSNLKDKMVGLIFIPKAGKTIFTRINNGSVKDDRFSNSEAKIKYKEIISNIPKDKKERYKYENSNWYGIYKRYQEKGQVSQSQKDYLTCRDLFIETVLFLVLYFLSLVFYSEFVVFSFKYLLVIILIAIVTNVSTHVKMNRFVNTVIALDVAEKNQTNGDRKNESNYKILSARKCRNVFIRIK